MVPYKLALDAVESQKSSLNFEKSEKKNQSKIGPVQKKTARTKG